MIIDLPKTTTREISNRLVEERDRGGAVALGRILTLIIDTGSNDPESAILAANVASQEHPCRVIVLVQAKSDTAAASALDAQIRLGSDAGASEVIVLNYSPAQSLHLDTLVLPLLLSDAPIVAWWPYLAPPNPSAHPIGLLARRRITNAIKCKNPVKTLTALAATYQDGDTDLAWTRTTLWRGLLAATLDIPPFEPVIGAVVAGESTHPSVDLIAAWLSLKLNCPVKIERQVGAPAITQVRLDRQSGSIVLSRPDGKTAALRQPGQPEHHISLPIRALHEALAEELRRLDADEVYGEVLRFGLDRVEA